MKKQAVLLSVVLCLLLCALSDPCHSQARRSSYGTRASRLADMERHRQERRAEFRRLKEERGRLMEQYNDQANREAVGADENQWKIIKPRMERLTKMGGPPSIGLVIYGLGSGGGQSSGSSSSGPAGMRGGSGGSTRSGRSFSAGGAGGSVGPHQGPIKKQVGDMGMGWNWTRPSAIKGPGELTETDKLCEGLLDLLEQGNAGRDKVRQCIEALREAREQFQRDLAEAKRELREVVTFEQEARLILMGYLD